MGARHAKHPTGSAACAPPGTTSRRAKGSDSAGAQASGASVPGMTTVLTNRSLNRALLARQHLLRRTHATPTEMITHVVGLQAQNPRAPYVGLWSRLHGFRPLELSRSLEARATVRLLLMRATVHWVTADDALALRPLFDAVMDRELHGTWAKRLPGVDLGAVAAATASLLADEPLSAAEIGQRLSPRWPDAAPRDLGNVGRSALALVQVPPRATWGGAGITRYAELERWVEAPPQPMPLDTLVERYLAAFGPATVMDIQAWSGLTRLGPVVDGMRERLAHFVNEDGKDLWDLPDAPRPGPDVTAPPRLIAEFDNVLIGHANRSRIIAPEHKSVHMPINGVTPGSVLVGGMFTGTWSTERKARQQRITITLLRRIATRDAESLEHQALRLARLLGKTGDTPVVDLRVAD